ncbi:MAG: antibiotic biosynthesis monooxygenase family protein, partial [Ignavibacteria bacterium]
MRFLQVKLNPDFLSEFEKFYKNDVLPQLQKIPGCLFAALINSKPEENEFASLTFWENQDQAED